MLALLPLDPRAGVVGPREPAVDGALQVGLATKPAREREVGELEREPAAEVAE